ncbi:hypothetical protein MMC09_002890 [Bachmanniomyces sp. S44760]|nr:hypothetical protein [Bachmanniomyces sp. S44760]
MSTLDFANSGSRVHAISFLDLPGEIRNRIYQFACNNWASVDPSGSLPALGRKYGSFFAAPFGLLRACRQTYHELAPQYYGIPSWKFDGPHQAREWIEIIGFRNAGFVRRIHLISSFLSSVGGEMDKMNEMLAWASVLDKVPALAQLTLDHDGGPDWSAFMCAADPDHKKYRGQALVEAVSRLKKLERFDYIGGRRLEAELLQSNFPNLTYLKVEKAPLAGHGRKRDCKLELPHLRYLQFGRSCRQLNALNHVSNWDTWALPENCARVKMADKQFCEEQWSNLIVDMFRPKTAYRYEMSMQFPQLEYLGVERGINFLELRTFPPRLKWLSIAFGSPVHKTFIHNYGHCDACWNFVNHTNANLIKSCSVDCADTEVALQAYLNSGIKVQFMI